MDSVDGDKYQSSYLATFDIFVGVRANYIFNISQLTVHGCSPKIA